MKRALVVLVALVAFAGLTAAGASAAPHHAKAKGGKIIVFPKGGEVVKANVARVSIRTGRGLHIRLNGHWIPAKEFGRARRGVRTMQASLSQGLRAGTNSLTVKLRRHGHRRRATVRFRVEPPGPLIGAGRDDVAAVGADVRLAGQIEPGAPPPAGDSIAWTPIRVPASNEPDCEPGGGKGNRLRSPDGLTANFVPRLPGEYVYRLGDGSGPGSSGDEKPVKVLYKNQMVPVETIVNAGSDASKRGIKVGRLTYLLNKAKGPASGGLQVLVLKRETLECISNTRYQNAAEVQAGLKGATSSELVIVAMQPGAAGQFDGKALYEALGPIGFPTEDDKALPTSGGSFSGIGVGKYERGDADVNILPNGSGEVAGMTGVLSVDQYNQFGYIPTLSQPFKWAIDDPIEPCKDKRSCENYTGYFIQVQNPRTGKVVSENLFGTGAPGDGPEERVEEMIKVIEGAPAGDVVQVVADSQRLASETTYPPSLLPVKQSTYQRLLKAIVSIGGTRNGFNKTAMVRGSLASSGQTYALVGWKGAKEGEGAEAAANVYGQSSAPRLVGELRPNSRSLLRPALESEVATKTNLADVVMWQPSEKWPLEDNAGEMRALAYLGVKVQLGEEPRLEYWERILTPDAWNARSLKIAAMKYSEVPIGERKFTEAEFNTTVTEFANELKWVGKTKEYLTDLSEPFSSQAFDGWATAEEIAKKIYAETNATNAETSLRWVEFTSIMLKLAGPLTGHISNTLGELLDLGVWGFGASESGRPTYTEVSLKATEIAGELRKELEGAAATYKAMIRVIVSDPYKLKKVGTEANCSPNEAKCDPEFVFTEKVQIRASADIARSIRRLSYEKLVPTFYQTDKLNRDLYPEEVNGAPRPINQYLCSAVSRPWEKYDAQAQELASANLLVGPDLDHGGQKTRWQQLVLTAPTGGSYGEPPAPAILEDMFGKVPDSSEPKAKGLGMSPEQFLATNTWSLWDPTNSTNPPEDTCVWNKP
jgi:hypothetical protein